MELTEKASIRKHNVCSLILSTDVIYSDVENLTGGKLKYYYEYWKKYTSDTFILGIIKNGLKLDFNGIRFQCCCNNFPLSKEEMRIINSEIQKLKSIKAIVNTDKRTEGYISDNFTSSKKDGSHRMILNLKNFKKFICFRHFEMESIITSSKVPKFFCK